MGGQIRRLLACGVLLGMLGIVPSLMPETYAQGTIYTDAMDSSATGLLSSDSTTDARSGYQNGQYVIQTVNPGYTGDLAAFPTVPTLSDASLAVDVSIAPDLAGKYAFVGCRGSDTSAYLFELHPDTGSLNLWRLDPGNTVSLGAATDVGAVNAGSGNNRLEIQCVGSTITGSVNGQQVLTAQDATYQSGDVFIGTGKDATTTDLLLTGFDNLTITDLGGSSTIPQPTQVTVPPTQPAVPATQQPAPPEIPTAATGSDQSTLTPITEPSVDPARTFQDAQQASIGAAPLFYQQDDIPLELSSGNVQILDTGVQVSDFYAELHFHVESDITGSGLLVSYSFWNDGNDNGYQIAIAEGATVSSWLLAYTGPAGYQEIARGDIATGAIDLTPDASNVMCLAVYHGFAILSVNGSTPEAVVPLTLPAAGEQLQVSALFQNPGTTGPMTMNAAITLMGVWDLSSGVYNNIFGLNQTDPTPVPAVPVVPTVPEAPTTTAVAAPQSDDGASDMFVVLRSLAKLQVPLVDGLAGPLTQETGSFVSAVAGVSVPDFYATATFVNPTDMSTPLDIGLGFRSTDLTDGFVLLAQSDGQWFLLGPGLTPLANGLVTQFDATPGGSNTLEVIAHGPTGYVAINGTTIVQVDLSANLSAGDVFVATGLLTDYQVVGRVVQVEGLSVYPMAA